MTMLFKTPKVRYPPKPAPGPPPGATRAELEEMEKARKRATRGAKGRAGTLLTGGQGMKGWVAPVIKKALLGQ